MENMPFSSSDSEDTSSSYESIDDDDDEESEDSSVERGRSLFSGEKDSSDDQESSDYDTEDKKSLFAELIDRKEDVEPESVEVDDVDPFIGSADYEDDLLNEEFQEVVEGRLDDVEASIESAPPAEVEEFVADASFLSSVGDKMAEGVPPQEAIEDAMEETIEDQEPDLGNEENEFIGFEQNDTEPEEDPDPPAQQPVSKPRSTSSPTTPPPVIPPLLTPASNTPGNGGGAGPGGYGRGGGRGQPPMPPTPNTPPPTGGNTAPQPASPNVLTPDSPDVSRMNEIYYRDKRRGDLLLGGAIGYLFGRRRGRKKAEARLEPVISAKEDAIEDLKGDLERSEETVRKAAAESKKETVNIEVPPSETEKSVGGPPRPESIPAESLKEELKEIHAQEEEFGESLISDIEKMPEPKEADQESQEDTTPELAYDATAEKAKAKQVAEVELQEIKKEHAKIRRETINEQKAEKKNVKMMNTEELLEVAGSISLDSVPLRELYETGRIDDLNLRRVITEFIHGNNYEKVLRRSLEYSELRGGKKTELNKDDKAFNAYSSNKKPGLPNIQATLKPTGSTATNVKQVSTPLKHVKETVEEDETMRVSGATAITIGVLSGIAIVILALLYNGNL